jgi:hypothetical protein
MQQKKTGIVLNIDGVLTNVGTYLGTSYLGDGGQDTALSHIDRNSLRFLKILCKHTGAEVIIYSAWAGMKTTPDGWKTFFGHIVQDVPVVEVVSIDDYYEAHRRKAVLASVAARYEQMLLISDDIDEIEAAHPHVRTTMRTGFQLEHLAKAASMLGANKLAQDIQKALEHTQGYPQANAA